jgi:hypothetical protein
MSTANPRDGTRPPPDLMGPTTAGNRRRVVASMGPAALRLWDRHRSDKCASPSLRSVSGSRRPFRPMFEVDSRDFRLRIAEHEAHLNEGRD